MKTTLIRTGLVAAFLASSGLTQAQTSPSPSPTAPTSPMAPVAPPGVPVAPGVTLPPGGTVTPTPGAVPGVSGSGLPSSRPRDRALSPLPGASDAASSPQAGSLSSSVQDRNRPRGDTLGTPIGNGSVSGTSGSAR